VRRGVYILAFSYNKNYFLEAKPSILGNDNIREPQVVGYARTYEHFVQKGKKSTHAIIVIPTGVGKTGLIALLPFHISHGRVLIITPQLTIKDTIMDGLDTSKPENFWIKRRVFDKTNQLPSLVEYDTDTHREVLDAANIVVVNIQKLQARLDSSPLKFLPKDYFDMIIIDEAHHSTARTWVETVHYFSDAKVVKVTGTPIRTDKEEIAGELIYKYKLSQAMANNYVKSLENIVHVPGELYLTIDADTSKKYTVDEIYAMDDMKFDENWVKRKVAYSLDCSQKIVQRSIELLEQKLSMGNKVPHKIIAVACSIEHANQIKDLYDKAGYPTDIIHSQLSPEERKRVFFNIKNHRIKVIVNVSMLGEGYDHPYLSIGAIFRPFINELPYAQFIGRILRNIPQDEVERASDNVAQVVSHKYLYLDELWSKYKIEIQESEIIKHLKDVDILEEPRETINGKSPAGEIQDTGTAQEVGSGSIILDSYLNTELIRKKHEEDRQTEERIKELQQLLNVSRDKALEILNQVEVDNSELKRPDLYFADKKKAIDTEIKQIIVPRLITEYEINQSGNDLKNIFLFKAPQYKWITKGDRDNGGMLAIYLNTYLKNELGKKKDEWTIDDYDVANDKLKQIVEYVEQILTEYKKQ